MTFGRRMQRRKSGPKREKISGGWGKLHNEGLHNFYPSSDIARVIRSREID
jgi:hypothetical protein